MVMVKICGVTREEDLESSVQTGADAIGFVINVEQSSRNLSIKEAKNLIDQLTNRVDSVAVTISNRLQEIQMICRELTPDFLQLHGVTSRTISEMRLATDTKVIVAVDARSPDALEQAISHRLSADALLADTYGARGLGGTGHTHDWNLSRRIRDTIHPVPMILAGGLTPVNVGEAVRTVKPYGVDVSTGVEAQPGIKDAEKIAQFIKKAKEADTWTL